MDDLTPPVPEIGITFWETQPFTKIFDELLELNGGDDYSRRIFVRDQERYGEAVRIWLYARRLCNR